MYSTIRTLFAALAIAVVPVAVGARAARAQADRPAPTGLVLWLDASDSATYQPDAGSHIRAWRDKSGHGNDVAVPDPVTGTDSLPSVVAGAMNGRPVVHLNGGSAFLGNAIREKPGAVTILIVSRRTPGENGTRMWQRLFSSRPRREILDNREPNFCVTVKEAAPYEATISFTEESQLPIGPFAIGRNVVGDQEDLHGDIAEVLVYDRAFLSQGDRNVVLEYLTRKWGASVPADAEAWTRVGELGKTPKAKHADLPLSDQANEGNWKLDPKFSDDFNSGTLDPTRWHANPGAKADWLGREPALFTHENATVSDGKLHITYRKQTVPEMAKLTGYADYTSALVRTVDRTGYGYYEARCQPMNSASSSAFWLAHTGLADNETEIDVFEIGGKAPTFDHKYNMNAHVWRTPKEVRHWSVGGVWLAPWRFAEDEHVYGFDWEPDKLRWYVDGVLVREAKNTNWFFPMQIVFDAEAMWTWFGKADDADLPSTYNIDYVRVWRRGDAPHP